MRSVLLSALAVCVLAALATITVAQDNESPSFIPAQITVTPHVTPPKEALDTGLGGTVRVKISIDAAGTVTSADDVVGPGYTCRQVTRADVVAMRAAAKEAALTARFNPATNMGRSVASTTWLSFTFPGSSSLQGAKGEQIYSAAPAPSEKMTMSSATAGEIAGSTTPAPDLKDVAKTKVTAAAGSVPKQINGGILNGKATSLPKPVYPPAARAVRAEGTVSVQVLIDEDGGVFSAEAIAGHPLLRSTSVAAACESRFSPTQLSGNPVKILGVITYNFVP